MDIGCYLLNNFVPFKDRGCELFGIEVNQEMLEISKAFSTRLGMPVKLKIGTNRNIPFEDNFFDFIVSIGTLHYEENIEDFESALREIIRVSNDNAHVVIGVSGSKHTIRQGAEKISEYQYRLRNSDFRTGQLMTYFEDEKHFSNKLKEFFRDVEVGVVTEELPLFTVQTFVAKCVV